MGGSSICSASLLLTLLTISGVIIIEANLQDEGLIANGNVNELQGINEVNEINEDDNGLINELEIEDEEEEAEDDELDFSVQGRLEKKMHLRCYKPIQVPG